MAPFRELYSKFRSALQESWQTGEVTSHFGPTANLDSMFWYLWSLPEAQQLLLPPAGDNRISRKGAAEAEKFRNEGNRFYREKKLEKALLAYNYSILAAPHESRCSSDKSPVATEDSDSLALGYANRSAVLYETGQYETALEDIARALQHSYPPTKAHRLLERRAKCLLAMGRSQEAKKGLEDAINMLKTLSLEEKDVSSTTSALNKLLEKCDDNNNTPLTQQGDYDHLFYTGPSDPPEIATPNPSATRLSDAVSLAYTPARGRHLVAARDIQPGEVLVVEEAVCAVVKLEATLRTFCSHCVRRAPVPLPCPSCSLVVFCSEECRNAGLARGHDKECSILATLVALQLDPAPALALRVLTSINLTTLRAYLTTIHREVSGGGQRPQLHLSHDYRALYHLEGHATARPESQLQETAALACVLTHILLEYCPNFLTGDNVSPDEVKSEDIILVGGQLMRLILGLECNIHTTKEVDAGGGDDGEEGPSIKSSRGKEVGWAVYSTLSLINHSCIPNALTTSLGSTKFLYSISIIPKGAEITDSYGERYITHTRSHRRASLQQHYFFCCGCAACQADWPLLEHLPGKPSLRCPSCCQALAGFTCKLCQLVCTSDTTTKTGIQMYDAPKTQVEIGLCWAEYVKLAKELSCGKVTPEIVAKVVNVVTLLDKYSVHPNQAYVSAQETLMTCFDLMGSVRLRKKSTEVLPS